MELLDKGDHISRIKIQCPICNYYFMNEEDFEEHSKRHVKKTKTNSKFKCMVCKFTSPSVQTVKRHVRRKHPTILIKFKCNECGEDFVSNKLLRQHKKGHHSICDVCGKSFDKRKHLTTHKKLRHSENFEKRYKCLNCPREFVFAHKLKKHEDQYKGKCYSEALHPESQQYVCDKCYKAFTELHALQKHEQMHKEKPYECVLCHAPSMSLGCLRNHINRVHTNLNKNNILFSCQFCGKSYTRMASLNEHIVSVHNGDRIYVCAKCAAPFTDRQEFEKHRRTHFECMFCGKRLRGVLSHSKHEQQCRLEQANEDLDNDLVLNTTSQASVAKEKTFMCPLCEVEVLDVELADHLCNHAAKNHNETNKEQLQEKAETNGCSFEIENSNESHEEICQDSDLCDEELFDVEPANYEFKLYDKEEFDIKTKKPCIIKL